MFLPAVKEGDWTQVRKNFQKLSSLKLGQRADITFADLTLTNLTASQLLQTDTDKKLTSIALPLIVAKGGTGATTLTDGGILLGSGTGAITALGVATNGQIPIGDNSTDPVLATLTGTSDQITVTNGAGSITLSTPQNIDTEASVVFADITLNNTGLHLLDTNASHDLIIAPGSDLTADRTLTLTTGDAARTITLSGNPTLSDWFDQSVKQAATPTFAGAIINSGVLQINERSSDPAEPGEGESVIWLSDGTGYGDDGDVCIASKAASTTKKVILFDHSAGDAW